MLAASTALAAAGCGGSEQATTTEAPPTPTTTTAAAGGEAERPPAVGDGEGGIRLVELGSFDQPVYVTQPPRGDRGHLYVVEQCGTVQRVPAEGGKAETFLDISGEVSCGAEQGLLSIAFAPDYERSGLLYADYTDTEGDTRVVEYQRASHDPATIDPQSAREVLFVDQPFPNHNGGLVLFGPDRKLYVGLGDGGSADDPQRNGQDLSTLLGKILRIDPREAGAKPYSVPGDNPHADEPGARGEIAVAGLRNPWRFSFDRQTGDLWIGDVGQDALEEIDSAPAMAVTGLDSGLNFGWSAFEGTQRFNADQEAPNALPPTFEYANDGGCSVTGGYVVRDPALRSLYGRYLYGDFCEGELRSFTARRPRSNPNARGVRDDLALGIQVPALSSFGEDHNGHLYATSLEGPVYRLRATR